MKQHLCHHHNPTNALFKIVLTGGPGAGKTALLEIAKQTLCGHISVAQETASILFGGHFPRGHTQQHRMSTQRAIFYVQKEIEYIASLKPHTKIILCDRGTIDGLAYWPQHPEAYWAQLNTSYENEIAQYHAVIHLRTPSEEEGYQQNNIRIETAIEAANIDKKILSAWSKHPRRHVVESSHDFISKITQGLSFLKQEISDLTV